MGCEIMQSGRSSRTFWRHMTPPSLGSKTLNKQRSMGHIAAFFCHVVSLVFDPEDDAVYTTEASENFHQLHGMMS
jgi:hypothetical protein